MNQIYISVYVYTPILLWLCQRLKYAVIIKQVLNAGMANPWLLTHRKAEIVCMWIPLWCCHTSARGPEGQEGIAQSKPSSRGGSSSHGLILLLLKLGSLGPSCALDPDPLSLLERNAWLAATGASQLWTLKENLNTSYYIFQSRHCWIKKLTLSSFSSSSVTSPSTSSKAALHG